MAEWKEPNSRLSTEHNQEISVEKAEKLNRNDIMLRLIGDGHDMVANDTCIINLYHKLCHSKQSVSIQKNLHKNVYDLAFTHLIEQIEKPLFNRHVDFWSNHYEKVLNYS